MMATSNSTGMVINELLCFVTNKCDLLPAESIIQLCCDTFGESDIELSKKLLFDLCADHDTPRMITRKGPKKSVQNMEDMLKLIQEKGTDLPTFVAHNLQLLPPIGFNSLDVSTLLHEIKKTQVEVEMLKDGMKRQADTIAGLTQTVAEHPDRVVEYQSRMSASVSTQADLNRKCQNEEASQTEIQVRHTCSQTESSFDMSKSSGKVHSEQKNITEDVESCRMTCRESAAETEFLLQNKPKQAALTRQGLGAIPKVKENTEGINDGNSHEHTESEDKVESYADKVNQWKKITRVHGKLKSIPEESQRSQSPSAEPNRVSRPRNQKKKHVDGSVKNTGLVTVKKVEKKKYASIFASRFSPDVTSGDLQDYLEGKTGLKILVRNVKSRYDTYTSFHVLCECDRPGTLLRDELWPEGAYVRWWRGDYSVS